MPDGSFVASFPASTGISYSLSVRIHLVPKEAAGPGQCPYCRDPVSDARDAATCPGCGVRLHRECHAQLVRCTTVGCVVPVRRFRGAHGVLVADRWEVYQRLGHERWGMAVHAWDQQTARDVTLLYLARGDFDDAALGQLARAGAVRAPGLVPTIGAGRDPRGHRPFLIRDFVPGETLASFMQRRGPLMLDEVVWVGTRLLTILEPLHARGLAHEDLRPDGLVLAREDHGASLRLLNLGLAPLRGVGTARTSGRAETELAYLPPEALERADAASPAARDLYAVGVLLYHALTGRFPVEGRSALEVMQRLLRREVTPLRAHLPRVSQHLEGAIVLAIASDPRARHANVREFRDVLAAVPV